MRIQGLGVIDDAVLELSPGFTVLTGETGAGKTMVVTGLGLLFGGRADSGRVRDGAGAAFVEGRLQVDPGGAVDVRVGEVGAELEDGSLLVTRTVTSEGRSRAAVGGRAAPISMLSELADDLVAMHGQNDQHRLRKPAQQRDALDRYAGEPVGKPLSTYREGYERLKAIDAELAELVTRARERAQEADLLRFGLTEIEKAEPLPGEDVDLAAEIERLSHADSLHTAATVAHEALLGAPDGEEASDANALVGSARRALEQVRTHDMALAELADRLAEVSYLLSDLATDLAAYAEGIDADPARLAYAQDRKATLVSLMRKYGDSVDVDPAAQPTIEDVLAWAERAEGRLGELDTDDDRIEALRAERTALHAELGRVAAEVSAARQDAARRFADAVTEELHALAMPHAVVTVAVTQSERPGGLTVDGRVLGYGSYGVDDVEILLTPPPGAPARPVQKGASGGELSRVMLAVEVVFAGADPVATFVFDEVDAGVGGAAAVEVGKRLARLARTAQVLVVTHLPQVAAFADQHLAVEKSQDGLVTRSGVTALDRPGRIRELSRMLAGQSESESAQAHAEELLDTAATVKSAFDQRT